MLPTVLGGRQSEHSCRLQAFGAGSPVRGWRVALNRLLQRHSDNVSIELRTVLGAVRAVLCRLREREVACH